MLRHDWFMPPMFIRNNYYNTSLPFHSHCCNGGNNMFSMLMGFGLINNMMTSILSPRQQYYPTYPSIYPSYPGLDLQQRADQDLINCKMLYPDYNFVKIGDEYCCTTPDGTLLKASTASELLTKIDEAKNKAKVENPDVEDPEESEDPVDTPPASAIDPQTWTAANPAWVKEQFTNKGIIKPTVDQVIAALSYGKGGNQLDMSTLTDEQKANLKADLIDLNSDLYDESGNIKPDFDISKLKIPKATTVKNTYGAKTRFEHDYVLFAMKVSGNKVLVVDPITGEQYSEPFTNNPEEAAQTITERMKAKGYTGNLTILNVNDKFSHQSDAEFNKSFTYHVILHWNKKSGAATLILPDGTNVTKHDVAAYENDEKGLKDMMQNSVKAQGWSNIKFTMVVTKK